MIIYKRLEDKLLAGTRFPADIEECWPWVSRNSKLGYGKFRWQGIETSAHRAFYKAFVDSKIDGLFVDHLCRNPACVNPLHLEAVTPRENTLRGISPPAMNIKKTHCPQGHAYSKDNLIKAKGRRCKKCAYAKWRVYYYQNRERLYANQKARRAKA